LTLERFDLPLKLIALVAHLSQQVVRELLLARGGRLIGALVAGSALVDLAHLEAEWD
jgi:hypothetical protein